MMVVLTAPSGTGKTTIARQVLEADPWLAFSVSHTTRPPRPGEEDGVQYRFVDDPAFDRMVEAGEFAEWAHVHSRRYGTSRGEIARRFGQGLDVLFDIDPQGGVQLMDAYPDAVTIFVLPPSMEELERRLRGRGTEAEDQVAVRLGNAREEIGYADRYDYVIVNDDLSRAVAAFEHIIAAERLRSTRRGSVLSRFQPDSTSGE